MKPLRLKPMKLKPIDVDWSKPDDLIGKFIVFAPNADAYCDLIWKVTQKTVLAVDWRGYDTRVPKERITATEKDFADPYDAPPVYGVFEQPTYSMEDIWIDTIDKVAKEKGIDRSKIHFGHDKTFNDIDTEELIAIAIAQLRKAYKANISRRGTATKFDYGVWQLDIRDDNIGCDFKVSLSRSLLADESNIDYQIGIAGKALPYRTKCMLRVAFSIYK